MAVDDGQLYFIKTNPGLVYYIWPEEFTKRVFDAGEGLSETQQQWIINYLDIDRSIFGDPVLAIMGCCHWLSTLHEWEDAIDVQIAGLGPCVPKGKALRQVLGREDQEHIFRCRNSCHKLADSIEFNSIQYMNLPPALLYDFKEGDLLEYAARCNIRPTHAGRGRRRETRPISLPLPSSESTGWADENEVNRRQDAFTSGWSPELGERLRTALRRLPLPVDGDPAEVDPPPAYVKSERGKHKFKTGAFLKDRKKGGRRLVSEGGKRPKHFEAYVEVWPHWEAGETSCSNIAAAILEKRDDADFAIGENTGTNELTADIVRGAFRWFSRKENVEYMKDHVRQQSGINSKSAKRVSRQT